MAVLIGGFPGSHLTFTRLSAGMQRRLFALVILAAAVRAAVARILRYLK